MLWFLFPAAFSWDTLRKLFCTPLSVETFNTKIRKLSVFKHVTILTSVMNHLSGVHPLCALARKGLRRSFWTGEFDTVLDHVEVAPVSVHLTVNENLRLSGAREAPAFSWTEVSDAGGVWHGADPLHPCPVVFAHVIIRDRKRNLCAVDRDAPGHGCGS